MEETPKIVLPKDESIKRALEAKLDEYRGRLDRMRKQEPFMHPELFTRANAHSVYKCAILERLLDKGEVDTPAFSLELQKLHGFFDALNYDDAAAVIDDYCMTGGSNVNGGTGLAKKV